MFRFKQFDVCDDRCAMKVGTDGVLLGAWADCPGATILDVGSGSGLIALMLAQRFQSAQIIGYEIDAAAARQARENVAASPFASRITILQQDYLHEDGGCRAVDAVVSNPPFYEEDLLPPDAARSAARHTTSGLTFEALIGKTSKLLREGGAFCVIIPKAAQTRFHALCNEAGLTLVHETNVRTVERKAPKRVLLHFVKGPSPCHEPAEGSTSTSSVLRDELILMADGTRTAAYEALCGDFYL